MSSKIEVGVLGATGMVGQHFIRFLAGHPWFEIKWVGASDRSAGKKYRDATSWRLEGAMPDSVADLTVVLCRYRDRAGVRQPRARGCLQLA